MDENTVFIIIGLLGLFLILGVAWALTVLNKARQKKEGSAALDPRRANTPEAIAQLPVDQQIEKMRKSIRSWAWIMLGIGAVSVIVGQVFNSPWGIIQVLVGLASFYFFSDYAMFMIYAGVFAWAGLLNLASFTTVWFVMGVFQLSWAWSTFRLFNTYQKATRAQYATAGGPGPDLNAPPPIWEPPVMQEDTRAQRAFPWLALFLGVGGAAGFVFTFLALITLGLAGVRNMAGPAGFGIDLTAMLSIIGVLVAVASLRAGYRPKPAAIIGLVFGVIMAIVYIGLLVMARLRA